MHKDTATKRLAVIVLSGYALVLGSACTPPADNERCQGVADVECNVSGGDGDYTFDRDGFMWGTEAIDSKSATTQTAVNDTLHTWLVKYRIFASSCSLDMINFSPDCALPSLASPVTSFNLDELVAVFKANGWSMLPMISYTQDEPPITSQNDIDNYVAFIDWFVDRYKVDAEINYLEQMNAPNMDKTLLLSANNAVYNMMKSKHPNISVGTPGFEYWDDPVGFQNMLDEIEYFLTAAYGAKFDFWAFHGYNMCEIDLQAATVIRYAPTMSARYNQYAGIPGILEVRRMMDDNGWQDRQIIDTEHFGLMKPAAPWTTDLERLEAAYLVQELLLKRTLSYNGHTALTGIIPMKIAGRGTLGEFANAELSADGSVNTPVAAVARLWSMLDGYSYVSRISGAFDDDSQVWVEKFQNGNNELYIFFKPFTHSETESLSLSTETTDYQLILPGMPTSLKLTDLYGVESTLINSQANLTLTASNEPAFLEVTY